MRDDFDWTDDEVVVVPDQPAVAVYTNPSGAVVIRQEGRYGVEEDHWVTVRPELMPTVIAALQRQAGLGSGRLALPPPANGCASEPHHPPQAQLPLGDGRGSVNR